MREIKGKMGFLQRELNREKEKEQLQKETKSSTESHVIEKSDTDGYRLYIF